MQGLTPVMTLSILVQNTSSQDFTLRSLGGTLTANGYVIGNLASFQTTVIRGNSEGVILVEVTMFALGVVYDIIQIFATGNSTQEIELRAYANVDNYQIPVNMKFIIGQKKANAA